VISACVSSRRNARRPNVLMNVAGSVVATTAWSALSVAVT
jgi:hypothetical protein